MQIALSEAQKIDASYEEGEGDWSKLHLLRNSVVIARLNLRQTFGSKILELERQLFIINIYR